MLLANQYSVEMARSNLSKEGRNLKRLTVSDKLAILDRLDRGERQCEIVKTTKLSQAVVSRIKKDGEKLRKIQKDNSPLLRSTYTLYKSKYPQVDQAVYDWFVDVRHQNGKGKPLPLTRRLIQSRAKQVADKFGIADFNASNGWFARWLWRFNISKYNF
jgi:Tc5 transposase DNA-binding domain